MNTEDAQPPPGEPPHHLDYHQGGKRAWSPAWSRVLSLAGASLVFIALAGAAVWAGARVYRRAADAASEMRSRREGREQAVAALKSAPTPQDIEQAVGPDGVFLKAHDNSWIAIRPSTGGGAVALDAGGGWYASDRDFGHQFGQYQLWQGPRARAVASHDLEWSEQTFLSLGINRQLDAIEQSASLPQAAEKLAEMGFEKFQP